MAEIEESLRRIAAALERLAPPPATALDLDDADAFGWEARAERLRPDEQEVEDHEDEHERHELDEDVAAARGSARRLGVGR